MAPSTSSSSSSGTTSLASVTAKFLHEYGSGTPAKCKIVDAYLAYILVTGVMQVNGGQPFIIRVNNKV